MTQNTPISNIAELQSMLRDLSRHGWEIPPIAVDGIFGPETRGAVEQFQSLSGLPVTGEADHATWERLVRTIRQFHDTGSPLVTIRALPDFFTEMGEGDGGDAVYFLQIMLQNFARQYENLPSVPISGTYDRSTADAVKVFQDTAVLPQTGSTDRATWNRITRLYNKRPV